MPLRQFIDIGSATYHDYMAKVPVASKQELCLVNPEVRERIFPATDNVAVASSAKTGGEPNESTSDSGSEAEADEAAPPKRAYSKRF